MYLYFNLKYTELSVCDTNIYIDILYFHSKYVELSVFDTHIYLYFLSKYMELKHPTLCKHVIDMKKSANVSEVPLRAIMFKPSNHIVHCTMPVVYIYGGEISLCFEALHLHVCLSCHT